MNYRMLKFIFCASLGISSFLPFVATADAVKDETAIHWGDKANIVAKQRYQEIALQQEDIQDPLKRHIFESSPYSAIISIPYEQEQSVYNIPEYHEYVISSPSKEEQSIRYSLSATDLEQEQIEEVIIEEVPSPSQQYQHVQPISTETKKKPSQVRVYRSTTALPLFYRDIGLDDETAPLPFTVMLFGNYMQTKVLTSNFQGAALVPNVNLQILGQNLSFGNVNMPLTGFANVREVEQRFITGGARFAVHILPFWSVYGIFAYSSGSTTSAVDVNEIRMKDVDIKATGSGGFGNLIAEFVNQFLQGADIRLVRAGSTPFVMDFDAVSAGIGTSLSIGGKLLFTTVDANYVITSVESANIMIHTVNVSARVGMHKAYEGQRMAMWVGANYTENVVGSKQIGAAISVERLSDLFQLEPIAQGLVGDKAASIRWGVSQKPINVFSALVGMSYSPKRNFDIVTEVGFIDRLNIMVSASYNF